MTRDEAVARIASLLREEVGDGDLIVDASTSVDDIEALDSLARFTLMLAVESEFDVRLAMDEIVNLTTVGAIADVVLERQSRP